MFEAAIFLAIVGFGFLLVSSGSAPVGDSGNGVDSASTPSTQSDSDDVPVPNWNMYPHAPITYDRSTWPSGDRIWDICRAIARQEGADKPGSAPDRNNNPGDISDGSSVFGYDPLVSDSKVTHFPDKDTGWQWLYNKISNAASGGSNVYSADMSWIEIGKHWATDPNWPYGVASFLGVSPNSTLREYLG